jgi:hemerythrin-like domain-containing protein
MKVLVQNLETLHYVGGEMDWTSDADQALNFVQVVHAVDYAMKHGFENVRVVMKFEGTCDDVELPPVHLAAGRTLPPFVAKHRIGQMITITEALIVEHSIFCSMFDEIEQALSRLSTVAEVRLLTDLVDSLLEGHSETETELAYVALDHVLENEGHLERLNQDHREISAHLKRAQSASDCGEARRLLKEALRTSRDHFRLEERTVFPLIDRMLQNTTLEKLGNAWMQRYVEPSDSAGIAKNLRPDLAHKPV